MYGDGLGAGVSHSRHAVRTARCSRDHSVSCLEQAARGTLVHSHATTRAGLDAWLGGFSPAQDAAWGTRGYPAFVEEAWEKVWGQVWGVR
jgi:hypothetical protein